MYSPIVNFSFLVVTHRLFTKITICSPNLLTVLLTTCILFFSAFYCSAASAIGLPYFVIIPIRCFIDHESPSIVPYHTTLIGILIFFNVYTALCAIYNGLFRNVC